MERRVGEEEGESAGLLAGGLQRDSHLSDESFSLGRDRTERLARTSPPLWTWILLVLAVLAFSSSGVVFSMMPEVPSVTLASWRLQLTTAFLSPAALYEMVRMNGETRWRLARTVWTLLLNGTVLAAHFGLWVLSLKLTSLPHAMLLVCMSPVMVVISIVVLRQPISWGELGGTGLGVAGAALLALSSSTHGGKAIGVADWRGDLAALCAAALFVAYLSIGRRLRSWMPIFTYSTLVTGVGAAVLTLAAAVIEGSTTRYSRAAPGSYGLFQWALDPTYFPKIAYLAVVPGILGHTGFNALIKYMDPLILTLVGSVEPLVGSLLGYALGLVPLPSALTYLGGFVVIASTVLVSIAGRFRQKRQETAEVISRLKSHDSLELT